MTKQTTIRIILTAVILIALFFEKNLYFHVTSVCLIASLLIFDLIESNHSNKTLDELAYYLSWIIIVGAVLKTRGSYFGPFTPLFWMTLIKISTATCYLIKHGTIAVTRSILTKVWLASLALYCIELISNSTHVLSYYCLWLANISSFESLVILILEKEKLFYKSSLISFLSKG